MHAHCTCVGALFMCVQRTFASGTCVVRVCVCAHANKLLPYLSWVIRCGREISKGFLAVIPSTIKLKSDHEPTEVVSC